MCVLHTAPKLSILLIDEAHNIYMSIGIFTDGH